MFSHLETAKFNLTRPIRDKILAFWLREISKGKKIFGKTCIFGQLFFYLNLFQQFGVTGDMAISLKTFFKTPSVAYSIEALATTVTTCMNEQHY